MGQKTLMQWREITPTNRRDKPPQEGGKHRRKKQNAKSSDFYLDLDQRRQKKRKNLDLEEIEK